MSAYFFFFCVPQLYAFASPFWVRFFCVCDLCCCCCCFNPTIEIVTFRFRGWCVLGVFFLLPVFTRLRHECQDFFESVRWNACVHILDLGLCSHPKEFLGNGVRNHVNAKGENPLYRTKKKKKKKKKKSSSEEDRTHDAASSRTVSPTHYQRTILAPTAY